MVWFYIKFQEAVYYLVNLYTVTELKIIAFSSVAWVLFGKAVGGIDETLIALMCLVIGDFATGITAGYRTNTWSSKYGFKGMCKKATMFGIVAFMFCMDVAMGTHMLRGMAVSGFAIIEAMSILENIDRCGWGWMIPEFIRSKLVQIRDEKGVGK